MSLNKARADIMCLGGITEFILLQFQLPKCSERERGELGIRMQYMYMYIYFMHMCVRFF